MDGAPALTWNQALVFALTGERRPELGRQVEPDLATVVETLGDRPTGAYVVPAELREGIGPAQLAAALNALRARLAAARSRPVLAERGPDADERRLLAEVPPHHGG